MEDPQLINLNLSDNGDILKICLDQNSKNRAFHENWLKQTIKRHHKYAHTKTIKKPKSKSNKVHQFVNIIFIE